MRINKKIAACIVKIVLGAGLIAATYVSTIDSFWAGMGTALIAVGVIRLIQQIKYSKNKEYRENVDVSVNDERNQYIAMKSGFMAMRIFTVVMAVAVIVLKILGYDTLMTFAAYTVCLMMVIFWICYLYANKKY